jgi:hypothetical protein
MSDPNPITIITESAERPAVRGIQATTAPALVYLASLQAANSRTTMRRQLDQVAQLLGYENWAVRSNGTETVSAQ